MLLIRICKLLKLIDIYHQTGALLKSKFTPYIYILFFLTQLSGLHAQNYELDIRTSFESGKATFDLEKIQKAQEMLMPLYQFASEQSK